MMEFLFFDRNDRPLYRRRDALEAHHIHEEYRHTATFPDDPAKPINAGMRVGWLDGGALQLFEIRQPARHQPDGTVSYEAEHIAVAELTDCVVQDKRPRGVTAVTALRAALEGTGWQLGMVDADPMGSAAFYWISAWEALQSIRDNWGVALSPRVTWSGNVITGRYIDIRARLGGFHGVRLTIDRNVERVGVTYDDRDLVTALYGRGKGEVVGQTAEGADTYGRRITFADAVWRVADGDPADKPPGQTYVEDAAATARFGRRGRPRFGVAEFPDCENPAQLLSLTWQALQTRTAPRVTISMTCANLRAVGYAREGIALGDTVNVIIAPWNLEKQARVIQLDTDLLNPENTRPVIGDYRANVIYKDVQTDKAASVVQQIAQNAPSLLNGYIDTAVLGIMSSKTRRETLPDGSEMYITEDGNRAVRFAGGGILLSDTKDSADNWAWRTAITGSGMVADEITAGVLRAALVTILGNAHFYWDAANIICQDPGDTKRQLRFGQYDGEHYGLALTQDGGATWQTAIDFDGAAVSSALKTDFIQIMNDLVKIVSGGRVDIQTNDFALKNADGRNLLAVTSADNAAGDPGGQIELGEDGFPVKFAPSFILPPENGGTGYNFGQTHRLSVPPMDAFGSDGDAAIYYNGASDRFGDILPSLGGAGTASLFGVARTWNDQSVSGGYGQIGNNSPANGGLYGCWWSFRTPANVNLHAVTLRLRTCKIIGGQWYGWNVQNPVTVGLYASTASAAPLATAHLTPANALAEQAVSLEPSARLATDTTYYIAIFDPADALNKSRGFVALSGVVIPGQTGTATEGMFVKSNGRWVSMLEGMKIRAGTVTAASAGTAITYDGFDDVPYIAACCATTARAWSGDSGAIKIYNKTRTGATIEIGGSYASREVDWIAVGR